MPGYIGSDVEVLEPNESKPHARPAKAFRIIRSPKSLHHATFAITNIVINRSNVNSGL